MKIYHKYSMVALIALLLLSKINYAQYVLPNSLGMPLSTKSYENVEGSPFLVNNYVPGTIKLANGTSYKDVNIKYNEVEDVLYFKSNKGEELMFAQSVVEFNLPFSVDGSIKQHIFRNGYTGGNSKSYYEVLSDGTVQLLKRNSKTVQDDKEYNSATVNKKIVENVKYYLLIGDKMISLKRNKKFILSNLSNKQTQLETFITTNNTNFDSDTDLANLITYYNSI